MSRIDKIASELRAIALDLEPGTFMGTEELLTRRFGVSGPTLRKVILQLVHEEMIEVRRGVHGGYFANRPQLGTAARVAGAFLSSRPRSFDEFPVLLNALAPVLIDAVLRNADLNPIEPFAIAHDHALEHGLFVENVFRFSEALFELADNTALTLCISSLFYAGLSVIIEDRPAKIEAQLQHQQAQERLAQALLDRDRDAAVRGYLFLGELVLSGIRSSLERQREMRRMTGNPLPARKI